MSSKQYGRDIYIRNVPFSVIDGMERQAALQGKSRSQYARDVLAAAVESPQNADRIDREEKMFSYIAEILKQNIETMEALQKYLIERKDNNEQK